MIYRVGAYLRLSRDDERQGESLSIENQRTIVLDYIKRQGWELIDTYIDDGLTGTNFDRPNFQRMIDDVRIGKINCIVVKDLSRFGRNYIQIGEYTDYLFPSLGCRFIAINDAVDTIEKENELMPFKNLINEWYSRDQSKKVKSARIARAKNGYYMGSFAPYGYVKNTEEKPSLLVDEKVAYVVKRMFEMRASGLGYRAIATALNKDNILPPRAYYYETVGKECPNRHPQYWASEVVRAILCNEVYIGNLVQMRIGTVSYKNRKIINKDESEWVRAVGTHEPIVAKELWEKVQIYNVRRKYAKANKEGKLSLFAGFLECEDCGMPFKFVRDTNTKKDGTKSQNHAYICRKYASAGPIACTSHRIAEKILEELVKEELREIVKQVTMNEKSIIADIKKNQEYTNEQEQKIITKELVKVKNRITELDKLTGNLYEEMILGDIPRDTVKAMIDKYQKEKVDKNKMQIELEQKLTHSKKVDDDIQEWVNFIRKCKNIETLDRDILHSLVQKIIIGQKKKVDGVEKRDITIIYNFLGKFTK